MITNQKVSQQTTFLSGILLSKWSNHTSYVESNIFDTSYLLHIHWVQLSLSPCESWDYQFWKPQPKRFSDSESSFAHNHVTWSKLV